MDPVSVSVTIARPREEVFEYLADVANHAEFCDHYLVDWRLTREDSYGRGAGARFRVKVPMNRFPWADVVFAEVERPRAEVPDPDHAPAQPGGDRRGQDVHPGHRAGRGQARPGRAVVRRLRSRGEPEQHGPEAGAGLDDRRYRGQHLQARHDRAGQP